MSRPSIVRSVGQRRRRTARRGSGRGPSRWPPRRSPARRAMCPGQRTMHGTRMPPSHVVPLAPRSGALLPPSTPRDPLSLVKITIVSSSSPSASSSWSEHGGGPVDGLDRGAVAAVARLPGEALLHVDRARARRGGRGRGRTARRRGVAEEPHRLGDVALGQRRLVGLLLDHLVVEQQRAAAAGSRAGSPGVGSAIGTWRPMSLL